MANQIDEVSDAPLDQTGSVTSQVAHPSREGLDRELRDIKDNVLRMGAMVEDQIRATLKALVEHDAEAATAVIRGDIRINEAQRRLTTHGLDHDRDPGAGRP